MYSYQATSKKYTSLALTILLHVLVFLMLFFEYQDEYNIASDNFFKKNEDILTPQEERERAELIQRGGAPVLFQNMPEYKQETTNDLTYNPVKPKDQEKTPSPPQEQTKKTPEPKTNKDKPKQPIQTKTQAKPIPTISYNNQTHKTTAKRANINPGDGQKNASPHAQQLTFADILQGFNNMLKNGNNDWMSQKGKKGKEPDYQDLKAMSYMQKLSSQLRTAWDMGIDAKIQQKFVRGMSNFKFALSIAKNGDIIDLQIAQSTGILDIDTKLLSIIRSSGPFPPVPDHLKMQVFSMIYELMWS